MSEQRHGAEFFFFFDLLLADRDSPPTQILNKKKHETGGAPDPVEPPGALQGLRGTKIGEREKDREKKDALFSSFNYFEKERERKS